MSWAAASGSRSCRRTTSAARQNVAGPAPMVLDMLLTAWAATMGSPAFVSPAIADILGSARTFRQWVTDHAAAFTEGAEPEP